MKSVAESNDEDLECRRRQLGSMKTRFLKVEKRVVSDVLG